jgi:hypothetical protein
VSSIDSFPTLWNHVYVLYGNMKTMEILGFMYELVAPFLAILTKHINTCYMSVLQVFYDQICLGTLGFKVFEPKHHFYKCWTVLTRHSELVAREAS